MADNGVLSVPTRGTAPSPPAVGTMNVYVNTSGSLCLQDSDGLVKIVTTTPE